MSIRLKSHVEKLLEQRYYKSGENWAALVDRVVDNVCVNEPSSFKRIMYDYIHNRIFLPNSPCLVNAGTKNGLFACFVAGPSADNLEAHLDTLADIAQVAKAGGGCGLTGSFIRPKGSHVAGSAHGYAYGPCNFIMRVNDYMDMMTQSGFRRMALMATLSSDHPDLDEFIALKQSGDESKGALFNQSIMATDSFMRAARDITSRKHKQLVQIAKNAWNNGEPGLLFYDTINTYTPYKNCGCPPIAATNPCGEQLLPEYGSCNLGSINLAHDALFNPANNSFNFGALEQVTRNCIRFLDNVGIQNKFPNAKFAQWYADHRPVGLGIMGYADLLLKMGIPYGSSHAINMLHNILELMYQAANKESKELGIERGIPNHCTHVNRRNITLLSIAPTGSISFIADCSSSIEPIFAPTFTRQDERGEYYSFEVAGADLPHFRSAINEHNPDKIVTWQEHVNTQVIAQMWVDSGVSKTINMPESATVKDVLTAMQYAWEKGAKGITVYRNNSRQKQVLTTGDVKSNSLYVKRPKVLPADIHNISVNGDRWLLLVGLLNNKPYELFAVKSLAKIPSNTGTITKVGPKVYNLDYDNGTIIDITQFNSDTEQALTRQLSLSLRSGIDLKFIVEQLAKSEGTVTSFAKAVNRVLAKYTTETNLKCDTCGSKSIISQGGCFVCGACGASKCG